MRTIYKAAVIASCQVDMLLQILVYRSANATSDHQFLFSIPIKKQAPKCLWERFIFLPTIFPSL